MFRNKSVDVHQFAMVPSAQIPRSSFRIQTTHKTTFDAGYLVPVFVTDVLPGDTFSLSMTALARLATPLFPVMDNLYLDSFFFFVPNRLVWTNWVKFMGEQVNPADSINFIIPQVSCPVSGWTVGSVQDYFGLPTVGQITGGSAIGHSCLPLRAYNLIYNQWFRDENLQNSVIVNTGDGPDPNTDCVLLRRGKRHDYFTSCLPWTQKGGSTAAFFPTTIPVHTDAFANYVPTLPGAALVMKRTDTGAAPTASVLWGSGATAGAMAYGTNALTAEVMRLFPSNLVADFGGANGTINQLRQAFQIQKLLERDARGGTRYTEIIRAHFGVVSPDARLQRPEYLGGGTSAISINPVAQTSATGLTGGSSVLANLAAVGTSVANRHGFTQSFTEHGHIIGLVNVRADLTYQQGMRRMWGRSTRYDFYFPVFAMLGEQSVFNYEIYATGTATDAQVFGYQERWGDYRYQPSLITGLFRSTSAGTIDPWHLAQKFTALPTLNTTFIQDTPPLSRIIAVGAAANGAQFLFDSFFDIKAARPMPLYSVPGMIDHF